MTRLLITGANGHLGRRLISALPPELALTAVVRREAARRLLAPLIASRPNASLVLTEPSDAHGLGAAANGCDSAIHLIGTLKETRNNRYADAHETPACALLEVARRGSFRRVIYVSILGADPAADSACLRARAAVETLFRQSGVSSVILRVPMVLGENDKASAALKRRAASSPAWLYRAQSLEQPIYAGDVIAALLSALNLASAPHTLYELAGPESLPRAELVRRAGAYLGQRPRVRSLPLALGLSVAAILERLRANPPITRDMLRVLDHDDAIDPYPAARALQITLTSLDEMLAKCMAAQ